MILAIRTDSSRGQLILLRPDGGEISNTEWEAGRELSQQILVEVTQLLKKQKMKFEDLMAVIVYKGPGSFTSLRIGVSVANTIAYGLQIPVTGASGKKWVNNGLRHVPKTKKGEYVVPKYGHPPHVTKPKK